MNIIKFYKVNEPYGFFSNFSPHPIYINNERWNSVEHYFQASKFDNIEIREKIQAIESPMQVAIEGRDKKNIIRDDWEMVKEEIMYSALLCKFYQHPKLMKELLLTKDSLIIEHTKNDNYWGDGGDGKGKNRLGLLLMKVREEIAKFIDDVLEVLPPWIAFPTINQFDLFWRMGLGEEYLTQWSRYYLNTDQVKYKKKFPETNEWEGIYD
ncbi:NADAR family protein [Flavobacterium psychrophilum]|nr:NADAR family protein [Flavobacterium psychrophilum]AIN72535.1 swarming motility protein YbiA [Flavobacterium psychrophilum FPG101]EKT3973684.1 NADAR family protein [Flavobacterium psychrophilum]EKT4534145.1 NADAR family protein [Flavobacterium psychrophilum]EKT4536209.1 NADAR family protein [Flavobacterium psychrophilum]EKT4544376.1 NADAR family protein [Flavobacterium psychrophilum]